MARSNPKTESCGTKWQFRIWKCSRICFYKRYPTGYNLTSYSTKIYTRYPIPNYWSRCPSKIYKGYSIRSISTRFPTSIYKRYSISNYWSRCPSKIYKRCSSSTRRLTGCRSKTTINPIPRCQNIKSS